MEQPHLLPMIHRYFLDRLKGYAPEAVLAQTADYIVKTPLQGMAGIVGIAALALSKIRQKVG